MNILRLGLLRGRLEIKQFLRQRESVVFTIFFPVMLLFQPWVRCPPEFKAIPISFWLTSFCLTSSYCSTESSSMFFF